MPVVDYGHRCGCYGHPCGCYGHRCGCYGHPCGCYGHRCGCYGHSRRLSAPLIGSHVRQTPRARAP
eukprot:4784283-Pyramimonas_sp.AAC.1